MVPICYEESVVNGASFPCAVFMSIATENFVKEFLSTVFARTRLNGPSGTINGTMTRKYRRQLEREEMAFTRGELVKHTTSGFLPVEAREANTRQALGVPDLRLALELGGGLLGHMPLVVDEILGGYVEEELEAERQDYMESINDAGNLNGVDGYSDDMDIDESGWEWDGATSKDRAQLGSLLDDCLSMAA